MSFSILPETLSPATSPAASMPLSSPPASQEQTPIAPFPSPLPPDTTPAPGPPPIPPEAPPATANSPPPLPDPEIPFPPPVTPPALPVLSPPLPEAASPPPEYPSPPAPESSSPPPESFSPLPESSPPPLESSSSPSPESSTLPRVPRAPVNTNSPPPVITPPNPTVASPDAPLPAESIPLSPPQTPDATVAPALVSPPSGLSYSPPSAANGALPAAVQIHKPQPSVKVLPGLIGVCVIVVAVLVGAVACVVCCKRRRRRANGKGLPQHYYDHHKAPHSPPQGSFSSLATIQPPPIKPRVAAKPDHTPSLAPQGTFSYGQLSAATNGFSPSKLIGEGGFGCVYKGVMAGGKEVAVKRLRAGGGQGEREFRAEVDTISRIHHKHLVSLVGYCINGTERLLVYEFLPNDSLEFHLHGKQHHVMEWETRLKIAIGSAKGLAYLHEDCNPKIIHRDIKASNILLDFRFEAKVSDFGLAKSFSDTNSHISTRVVGTFGYLAPEYASSGKVTEKSDVYSYGVVLLELITGRPPISNGNQGLVEWARPLLVQATEDGDFDALADPRLQRSYDAAEMSLMVACAAACVRHSAWLRPRMSQIVHTLEGHAAAADLHEGVTPGSSGYYGSRGSRNDLNMLYPAATGRDYGNGSTRSGSTSEYGLDPSVSSGEAPTR